MDEQRVTTYGEAIWTTSRNDEGTISATGANIVARAVIAVADQEQRTLRDEVERLRLAVNTLLPGLRLANYIERWAKGSPAVQALSILSEFVGEGPVEAGDEVDRETASMAPLAVELAAEREAHAALWPELVSFAQRHSASLAEAARLGKEGRDPEFGDDWRDLVDKFRAALSGQGPTEKSAS